MKKKTDEELGILLTREIRSMMFNEKLTAEQRVSIFCSIVSGEEVGDPLLSAFAESLKTGFIHANEARKLSIYSKRERERERSRNHRQSLPINTNKRQSLATAIYGNGNGNGNNNPLPPKGGKGVKIPSAVSPEDLMQEAEPIDDRIWAKEFVSTIVGWYPYAVNQDALVKIIIAKCKKNLRRALEDGMTAWLNSGAWDEKRFVPPDIVKWIKLERFLDEPPPKKSPAARADGERALAAPSADATMRMIESEGGEE